MTVMVQRESVYSPPVSLSRLSEIESVLGHAIRGKADVLRLSLACLLARGHLLIEDVPGVGRVLVAKGGAAEPAPPFAIPGVCPVSAETGVTPSRAARP